MRHLARITATISSALALAVVGTVPVAGPAQAAPDTSDNLIQVVQHNTDAKGPGPAMQASTDWGIADAITFQELCANQRDDVTGAGYHLLWREQRQRTKNGGCRKGPAIASPHAFADTDTYGLLTAGSGDARRTFKLICADLRGTGVARTTVCTTHFPLDYNGDAAPTGRENRIRVANKIKRILNAKISNGRRVVMTGDFNDKPKTRPLDRFYRVQGDGRFWEGDQRCGRRKVCRSMEATTSKGNKIDYFFASSPGVNKYTGIAKVVAKQYDAEGHYVILGSVRFGSLR